MEYQIWKKQIDKPNMNNKLTCLATLTASTPDDEPERIQWLLWYFYGDKDRTYCPQASVAPVLTMGT